jgi:hypothetical protein
MTPTLRIASLTVLALGLGCAPPADSSGLYTAGMPTTTGATEDGGVSDDGASTAGDAGLLDTMQGGDATAEGGSGGEYCSFVDLVFVVDNSGSMGDYQNALGLAFPDFADTLASVLPPGVGIHVGVTSTEMAYAASGTSQINNGVCTFVGDGMPNDAFYITPDVANTQRNGAQGRLYDPGGGQTFYEFNSDDADLTGVKAWFASAAAIGTGGSNIEMSAAPVGWVGDAANAATNAGFIRDEGSVLVVFFMQDEPDQTPLMIDGTSGGQAILSRVADAKAGCGGLDCIVAGGFLNANACNGGLPLDEFLAGMPETPAVQPLPDDNLAENDPQAAANEMNALLSQTLAQAIATRCDQIPPVD